MEDKDRKELESLRISLARIAQALGAGEALPVKDTPYEQLAQLAGTQERGWNSLAAECVERAQRLHDAEYKAWLYDYLTGTCDAAWYGLKNMCAHLLPDVDFDARPFDVDAAVEKLADPYGYRPQRPNRE